MALHKEGEWDMTRKEKLLFAMAIGASAAVSVSVLRVMWAGAVCLMEAV